MMILMSGLVMGHSYTPVVYYELESDGRDSGVYGYNLTATNTVVYTTGCIIDNCSDFSDTDPAQNLVKLTGANLENISTLEFWVYYDRLDLNQITWEMTNGAQTVYDRMYQDDIISTFAGTATAIVDSTSVWYHIVTVWGANGHDVYINGALFYDSSDTDVIPATITSFSLGNEPIATLARGLEGKIDNVAMFEEEYTLADVIWANNSGAGRDYSTSIPTAGTIQPYLIAPINNSYVNNYWQNFTFNVTTSNESIIETCSLYTNESGTWKINQTLTTGLPVNTTLNISHTFTSDGEYLWNIGCNATGVNLTFATNNYTLVIDTINPTLSSTNFTNGTIIYLTNNTYQFNFTDTNFYSFLATLNGNVLNNDTGISIGSGTYQGNVTVNHTNLNLGANYLYIQGADGHTAKRIPNYKYGNGIWNNKLTYETTTSEVSIIPKEGSIFDSMSTKKEKDRYTFEYEPSKKNKNKYIFTVTSDNYIDIVHNPNTKWNTWLIIGDNWVDFYEEERPNEIPSYKRINDYEVEVTIKTKSDKHFKFSSIGDLNINSFNYTIYGINVTTSHSDPVIEGQSNTPYLYVYTGLNVSLVAVSAKLLYNGTTYTPTKTNDTQNYTFSKLVTAPILTGNSSNMTFYWNITLSDGSSLITLYQNVVGILIDNCSGFTISAVNFTMYDDQTNSLINSNLAGYFEIWINPTEKVYFNVSWEYATNHSLCIYDGGSYNAYGQMEYKGLSSDYSTKTYYIYNATFNNVTQFVNLYSTTNSTQIAFEVTDENDDAIIGAYVQVAKYDLTTNSYTINSILKTDTDGKDYAEMLLFSTWYKFFVYKDGVLLLETDPTKIITTSKKLRVILEGSSSGSYDALNSMTTSLTYNNVTKNFVYTFSNPTGLAKEFCLRVTRRVVASDVLVNNTCTTSTSGTLLVNIGAVPIDGIYLAYGTVSGSPTISSDLLEIDISDEAWKTYGKDGIFMTFFIKVSFAMIGIWNPIVAIALLVVADIVMFMMGIYQLSWSVMLIYIIMAAITIWKVNQK